MVFERYAIEYAHKFDHMEWDALSFLKFLEERVQYTSDSKEDIIDAFARTFENISHNTAMLCGIRKKAKKLANKVEGKFKRKEIVDFFKILDRNFETRQEEQDLENSFDKNGRILLKKSGYLNTLKLSARYTDREKGILEEGESSTSEQRQSRKKQKTNYNEEQILESPSEEDDQELHPEFFQAVSANSSKIEMLASLETKSRLENYNIICLFDVEFPYTKKLFMTLSTAQLDMLKNKWIDAEASIKQEIIEECWNACSLKKLVDDYHKAIEENINLDTLYTDFNSLMTVFTRQKFDNYQHKNNYELFWCSDFYARMALQLLRKRSALLDCSSSEFQYRDEIVNPLLAYIFYDIEDAIWIKTGEIENNSRKRQRNFSKSENERGKLGDKHDGILCMNVNGVKVEVGFVEVVGNAFTTITSDKNYDLEKLLKAMMISIWYQKAHQSDRNTSNLQSFSILVYGREFHFLSMHLVDDVYIVDEYDAFVIPDSGMSLSQIRNIIEVVKKFKIRIIKYYHQVIQKPRKVTLLSSSGLPIASPSRSKRNQN